MPGPQVSHRRALAEGAGPGMPGPYGDDKILRIFVLPPDDLGF